MTVYIAEAINADDVTAWAELPVLRVESSGEHLADNNARASIGARTVAAYAEIGGGDESEAETMVADLLGDLRHLCDAINVDFDVVLNRSEVFYNAEINGEL